MGTYLKDDPTGTKGLDFELEQHGVVWIQVNGVYIMIVANDATASFAAFIRDDKGSLVVQKEFLVPYPKQGG
jgi:hypothetical protein